MQNGYRYAIELKREDATTIGQAVVEPDWAPAVECALLGGVREKALPPVLSARRWSVQPEWSAEHGQPYVDGFEVVVTGCQSGEVMQRIPASYLRAAVQRVATGFVESGKLKTGERFRYAVLAFRSQNTGKDSLETAGFDVREVPQSLDLRGASLARMLSASAPFGEISVEDIPLLIPQDVLEEACALTRQAGSFETGGIFIGHLHRDSESGELFAVVTAQIPARHARSQLTRLTLTADTWASVDTAIALRDDGEIYLGWWHCHCFMKEVCTGCSKYKDGTCTATAAFMSAEDVALHRTVFPRAYSVALVISDTPSTGLTQALFGWRDGVIASRGFHVLDGQAPRSGVTRSQKGDGSAAKS